MYEQGMEREALLTPERLTELTSADVADFVELLPQLSSKERTPEEVGANVQAAIDSPTSVVFVVRVDGRVRASATGGVCRIPTGVKAWVDDVVTHEAHRGKGYGGGLMKAIHSWMVEQGATSSNLTSKPARVAAGGLYERLGYKERNTRVYRAALPAGSTAVQNS
jgi:predicted GNAT family acetyltransferase